MTRLTMTPIALVVAAVAQLFAWQGRAAGQAPATKDASAPTAASVASVELRVYNSDIHDPAGHLLRLWTSAVGAPPLPAAQPANHQPILSQDLV